MFPCTNRGQIVAVTRRLPYDKPDMTSNITFVTTVAIISHLPCRMPINSYCGEYTECQLCVCCYGLSECWFYLSGLPGWACSSQRARFEPPTHPEQVETVPIPDDLPAPVARFAAATFGDAIPVTDSVQITGRSTLHLNGLTLPARFKIYHDAGDAYYHYIQVTWFGIPVLTVNERYMDGVGIMDIIGEPIVDQPATNAAAYQALWAEAVWFPAIWFTDERVTWEARDDNSAILHLADAPENEHFIITFDPETGLFTEIITERYRDTDITAHRRWTNRALGWETIEGVMLPTLAETQWDDEQPWAIWRAEDIALNVEVQERLAQFGGTPPD